MNEDKNYLSLGNVFEEIKLISNNKKTAMQSEIFCSIFNTNEINNTTVNNYCIGYRPISLEYKKIYYDLMEKYRDNYNVFIPIIISIINILEDRIITNYNLDYINSNGKLKKLCENLISLAKRDQHIPIKYIDNMEDKLSKGNLYDIIINLLTYAILENNQPVYIQSINIKLNKDELEEYLKIKLYEGVSYIRSLQELSKKNNMYANAELGSLEFSGLVSSKVNYQKSYDYYLTAASKNHPKACFMVANLIINKHINKDYDKAIEYLEKGILLDNSAAINMMGNCYLNGVIKEKNLERAIYYYNKATEFGYVYAFNNLGLIKEKESNWDEAIYYYKISADLGESWALNKVGEYYRLHNELDTAYLYYLKALDCPLPERNYYAYYNLAKYYYLKNKKMANKGLEYLKIASEHNIKVAQELLNNYHIINDKV